MKVTFPHMGNMYVPIKVLLDTLKIDYVMPPFCNKSLLETGCVNSPEFACLPFKVMLGEFIYGLKNGADSVLFGGGCGQCRLGYYADLHEEILKSLGFNAKFINIELKNMSVGNMREKLSLLLDKDIDPKEALKAVALAVKVCVQVDRLSGLAARVRCRELEKGQTDGAINRFHHRMKSAEGYREINSCLMGAVQELELVKIDEKIKPPKVAIVGEIYMAASHQVNLDIEAKLGNLGVEVHNTIGVSQWVNEHLVKKKLPVKVKNYAVEAAREFLGIDDVGGHCTNTVGNAILYSKRGFDGVIQIYPFTCMPEIIAECTFSHIQDKYGVPIMKLVLDEMTGEGGYITRLEAFVDMIRK